MTDKKISELTNITGSAVDDANDELPIVDASVNQTKAITRAELFTDIDGDITLGGTVDGRDVAADGSKLDGIEAGADVTDTANVTAAGALMDSELTSEASVKGLDQGVATTDSPSFAGLTVDTDTLYVDSANNRVGIGTASISDTFASVAPSLQIAGQSASSATFSVRRTSADSNGPLITLDKTQGGAAVGNGDALGALIWTGFDGSSQIRGATISAQVSGTPGASDMPASLIFSTTSDGSSAPSEAMRIDSSGNVLVGKTSLSTTGGVEIQPNVSSLGFGRIELDSSYAASANTVQFKYNGSLVGSISQSTTSTSYNTSSDERLKENITDAQDASAVIDGIQVRQFDWKADGEHQRYGMIAQELDTVAPEAVTKGETEDDMWSVDYSKLVPMLVKEIQDLRKRVEELEQ